mgnify:FL=1
MTLDERYEPTNNLHLGAMLDETGFERSTPSETKFGAYFANGSDLFVILNPKKGTGVHDHPNHRGGTLSYLGPIVESDGNFEDTLAYKCQIDRRAERIPDEKDVVVTLSPGETFNLIYGSASGDRGVIGRFYGCHNLSDVPIALLVQL